MTLISGEEISMPAFAIVRAAPVHLTLVRRRSWPASKLNTMCTTLQPMYVDRNVFKEPNALGEKSKRLSVENERTGEISSFCVHKTRALFPVPF